jgi:hypothetical protein
MFHSQDKISRGKVTADPAQWFAPVVGRASFRPELGRGFRQIGPGQDPTALDFVFAAIHFETFE